MPRDILHLHIPDFPIAVSRVIDPLLRNRPVAVSPGPSERALLQCVSAEARTEGLFAGMSVRQAKRLCPRLHIIHPDPPIIHRAVKALSGISSAFAPLTEPEQPGRIYLDISGSHRLLGPGRDVAARLDREISSRLHLSGSLGLAGNKLVARIASGYLKCSGVCDILRGSEAQFIGTLPVTVLPGVGQTRAAMMLQELNLNRIGELASLPVSQLRLVFGAFAPLLRQRAQGIDPSPVQPQTRSPEITEHSFLPQAANDDETLLATLGQQVERCAFRLRQQGRGTTALMLTLYYADGVTIRQSARFVRSESKDSTILASAEALFYAACDRRVQVRGIRLTCLGLTPAASQLDLFSDDGGLSHLREGALIKALDHLRLRHGNDIIHRGKALILQRAGT